MIIKVNITPWNSVRVSIGLSSLTSRSAPRATSRPLLAAFRVWRLRFADSATIIERRCRRIPICDRRCPPFSYVLPPTVVLGHSSLSPTRMCSVVFKVRYPGLATFECGHTSSPRPRTCVLCILPEGYLADQIADPSMAHDIL